MFKFWFQFKSTISSSSNSEALWAGCFCLEVLLLLPLIIMACCSAKLSVFAFMELKLSFPAFVVLLVFSFSVFFSFSLSDPFDLLVSGLFWADRSEILGDGSTTPSSCLSLLAKKPLMKSASKSVVLKLMTHWLSKNSASFYEQAFLLMQWAKCFRMISKSYLALASLKNPWKSSIEPLFSMKLSSA